MTKILITLQTFYQDVWQLETRDKTFKKILFNIWIISKIVCFLVKSLFSLSYIFVATCGVDKRSMICGNVQLLNALGRAAYIQYFSEIFALS